MKLLVRAFDAAWMDVKGAEVAAFGEDRGTRLALVILELAREGSRSEREIKERAVEYMNRSRKMPSAPAVRAPHSPNGR